MSLQQLFNEKPTKIWHERMVEYEDHLFTTERLELCDKIIDKFINELIVLDKNPDQGKIMAQVEEIVVSFNHLNEENDYFIMTLEREELAEFIDKAAKLAGLAAEEDQDITEEWREW